MNTESRFKIDVHKTVLNRGFLIGAYMYDKPDFDVQVKMAVYVRANGTWRIMIFYKVKPPIVEEVELKFIKC